MSKIFNLNNKNTNLKDNYLQQSYTDTIENKNQSSITKLNKHYPSPVREWKNSIYVYNKNVLNLTPYTTDLSKNLIKSYFNLYNEKIEKRMRARKLLFRLKRLSCNKIFVSNAEFKHTNNVVLINLYVFNRQKNNYILKMKKKYINFMLLKKIKLNEKFLSKLQNIDNDLWFKILMLNKLKLTKINANISTKNHIESMYWKSIMLLNKTTDSKLNIDYLTKYFKFSLRKSFTKFRLYLYYRRLLHINKSKFNYSYLHILKRNLEKIYNKNVEFNIINLKRFYLNSDILTETLKLKVMKNRKKLLKFMTKLKDKVRVHSKKFVLNSNFWFNKSIENYMEKDGTAIFSYKPASQGKFLTKYIVNNLKYRKVTGFRLEARGRLTRRFTASRSLSKVRYKGNLLNIESSDKALSSVLLKGNLRSNLQYTKLSSKTRIGSFGLKGWISGN